MRIAQITDLHITAGRAPAYGVEDTFASAKRAIEHIRDLAPAPDVLLVTGDISDAGSAEALIDAAALLKALDMPVLLVPGNHDHRGRFLEAFSGYAYLRQNSVPERLCYALDFPPLRFIGLDSVIPGYHGGGLDEITLEWLNNELDARRAPTIVFMHHPPFPVGIPSMDADSFAMAEALEDVLRAHPHVIRLLTGHMHRPFSRWFGGTLAVGAPSVSLPHTPDIGAPDVSRFTLEPGGFALHVLLDSAKPYESLVSHSLLIPRLGAQFDGPHPFKGVVSPK